MRQHCTDRRGRGVVLLLALAFLVVPYFVDVVYLGDLTPTHFAQELETEDQDCQTKLDTGFVSTTNVVDSSAIHEVSPFIRTTGNVLPIVASAKIFPLQYLASAILISRPPPSAYLS